MNTHSPRRLAPLVTCLTFVAACGGGGNSAQTTESTASTSTSSGSSSTAEASPSPTEATTTSETSSAPTASAAVASAPPAAPAIPDAAMHVQSTAGATGWFARIDIERRDDASLHFGGTEIGRINAGRITTIDGQAVPLEGRLSIGVRNHREHLEMQPDGSITMDMGRLTIDASGDVQLTRGTNTRPAHVHITGYTPATARLAAILLTYGIMKADLATR